MPRRICFFLTIIWLAISSLARPVDATGGDAMLANDICTEAAAHAADITGAPLQILVALTQTETGRVQDSVFQPWPWTLNVDGKGQFFPSKAAALDGLAEAIASGANSIDVGCFQLNLQWHGANFPSLDHMMDPKANALYAAKLLASHAAAQGDWILAAGAYHSRTPDKAEAYLARFKPIYAKLTAVPPSAKPPRVRTTKTRSNEFPLLIRGYSGAPGSIVPRSKAKRVLIGGQ